MQSKISDYGQYSDTSRTLISLCYRSLPRDRMASQNRKGDQSHVVLFNNVLFRLVWNCISAVGDRVEYP